MGRSATAIIFYGIVLPPVGATELGIDPEILAWHDQWWRDRNGYQHDPSNPDLPYKQQKEWAARHPCPFTVVNVGWDESYYSYGIAIPETVQTSDVLHKVLKSGLFHDGREARWDDILTECMDKYMPISDGKIRQLIDDWGLESTDYCMLPNWVLSYRFG